VEPAADTIIAGLLRQPGYCSGIMSPTIPGIPALLLRGLTKRCPWCGKGKLFCRWFTLPERCPRCGLRFEREEGAFLGSLAINFGVTSLAFISVLVTWIAFTLPDPPVALITVASVAIALTLPLVIYPFAKTTWAAIDILMRWDQRTDLQEMARGVQPNGHQRPPPQDEGPAAQR
jgi:uncharacterized protein (DUF983 family)